MRNIKRKKKRRRKETTGTRAKLLCTSGGTAPAIYLITDLARALAVTCSLSLLPCHVPPSLTVSRLFWFFSHFLCVVCRTRAVVRYRFHFTNDFT